MAFVPEVIQYKQQIRIITLINLRPRLYIIHKTYLSTSPSQSLHWIEKEMVPLHHVLFQLEVWQLPSLRLAYCFPVARNHQTGHPDLGEKMTQFIIDNTVLSSFFKCTSTSRFTCGTFYQKLNNIQEYLIQHSLKSGGSKDHFRWVKVAVPPLIERPGHTVHSRTHCDGSPSETDCLSCLTWSLQVFIDCTPQCCVNIWVAKLGVVNLYLKVIKLWLACTCSCIYLITHYNFNSIILDK
jgi:hypothetical protein